MIFIRNDEVIGTANEPYNRLTLRLLNVWYASNACVIAEYRDSWNRENLMKLFRDISTVILVVQEYVAARGTPAHKARLLLSFEHFRE